MNKKLLLFIINFKIIFNLKNINDNFNKPINIYNNHHLFS